MKDEDVRERVKRLEEDIHGLNGDDSSYSFVGIIKELSRTILSNRLDALSLKDCPKCKHPVLAQKKTEIVKDMGVYNYKEVHQCLTCGSQFTCSNECVCKLVG